MGVPTAPLSTYAFKEAAEIGFGDDTPFIYTKHPVVGSPDDVLMEYIKSDPAEKPLAVQIFGSDPSTTAT